jgi:2-oxo-4-hydroxy-4-carboxy-5-ureidoimidazoline decarboxylase
MTVHEMNSLDLPGFLSAFGSIFEHSPWVAERAYAGRPFADLNTLHATMIEEVERAAFTKKLTLLRAHPDLGTRARLSQASAAEQSGAGLDSLTPLEFERLHRLNAAYRKRFGFPFLLAVKHCTKHDVLQALERRMDATAEDEYREALQQVYRIARFRLEELVTEQVA